MLLFIIPITISLSAALFSIFLDNKYSTQKIEDIEIKALARKLQEAVGAYLSKTYLFAAICAAVLALVMLVVPALSWRAAVGLVIGILISFAVGYFASVFIIRLDSRIASRSSYGFVDSLNSIFDGGGLLALFVLGMSVLVASGYYFIFNPGAAGLISVGLGAVIFAFFMKINGSMYRGSAGKKDSSDEINNKASRDPQVIIQLAGDAVIQHMGQIADLFATFLVLLISSMLASSFFLPGFGGGIALPLLIASAGLVASFAGVQLIKIGITTNIFKNMVLSVLGVLTLAVILVSPSVMWAMSGGTQISAFAVWTSSVFGILFGGGLLFLNYILNSRKYDNNLVVGAYGAVLFLIFFANSWLGGWYGVSIFAVSMMSIAGTALTLHMFNSASTASKKIAHFTDMPEEQKKLLDKMDVVNDAVRLTLFRYVLLGAVLGAFILSALYEQEITARAVLLDFTLDNPVIFAGIFLGLFGFYFLRYLTIRFLSRSEELSLPAEEGKLRYAELSNTITTAAAKRTSMFFGAVFFLPVLVGLIFRAEILGGFLVGMIIFGSIWSVSKVFTKPASARAGSERVDKTISFYSPSIKLIALASLLLIVFFV